MWWLVRLISAQRKPVAPGASKLNLAVRLEELIFSLAILTVIVGVVIVGGASTVCAPLVWVVLPAWFAAVT